MKTLIFSLFALTTFLYANDFSPCEESYAECEEVSLCDMIRPLIEVKAGYFFFSNHLMRDVYSQEGWDIQLCSSYPIWKWIQIYASVEYMQRHGRSLGANEKTTIRILPLNLGAKFVAPIIEKVHYYITAGPRYSFVWIHNDSSFVPRNLSENGVGGFVNTGFNFFPLPHFLIDIFAEYSYTKLRFHPNRTNVFGRNIQVGGYTFGGGVGYAF